MALILIFALAILIRYLLLIRPRRESSELHFETLKEREAFFESFIVSPFTDFSEFDFERGSFSHVSPFPARASGEWRYRIYLSSLEVDDVVTINHEISECALGRLIEKLLTLEKPLYLYRKEDDKFWVHGHKQKYLVEHVLATLGEVDDLTHEKLSQRLDKDDIKAWLNLPI